MVYMYLMINVWKSKLGPRMIHDTWRMHEIKTLYALRVITHGNSALHSKHQETAVNIEFIS
jgi:hypothetical protein